MSIPVAFLTFKIESVIVNYTPGGTPSISQVLGTLSKSAVASVCAKLEDAWIGGTATNINKEYNYITGKLQSEGFFIGVYLMNAHYLNAGQDVNEDLGIVRRYAPGTNAYYIDVECTNSGQVVGSTNLYYGFKATELSTGDYCLVFGTNSGQYWFDKNNNYYGMASTAFFVDGSVQNTAPVMQAEVFVVNSINDDGTLDSSSGYIWETWIGTGRKEYVRGGTATLPSWLLTRYNLWQHYILPPGGPDPYDQIPPSGTGGGGGTYDPSSSDDIDFPGTPGVSAVNTGFISLWSPTEQQMLNLSRYMWNVDITTIDFWKRLWADPMDIIYGLNIIPVDFRATGRTIIGGTEHVIVGLVDTKVDMDYLVSQWIDVDCGSIDIDEMWGAYLDYDPYTKLEIYLPYCGYHPLRIDDFMSGSISLKYRIDLLSGACIAIIKATKPNDDLNDLDSVIYQFMGNCATQIPVTASQFADAVRSTMSLAASIGTMVATGVGGAAAAASKQGLSTVGKAQLASSMIGEGAATVENVMGIKPAIERSGALGGAAGLLAVQSPYLILTRPRQARPETQNRYTGYPSFMTRELGQCFGWTIIKEIHLEDIPCTSEEMIEIDNLLKEGVIL